ncbi:MULTISPECIES: hypothetical protein [unclassified Amycolatopsis]|uniref:hypothetical protein n=1 Tax=unclassified Amycolatopsis TaxID=2618356 RepID=UPI0028756970|nr:MULTISPECIES: hypothetical protein [unclassified Amycolatopsis]MDS0134662.1 hypothetical protein [Amycolatopsis sp. 505]MDS0147439.1 hypothetical protein [Amycolatopsis sp. CM201R]
MTKAKLGRLAASALWFQAAAERWRDSETLPASPLAAIEYEVGRLLADSGTTASPTLPLDRKRRIAMRMAAMAVFGGINRFARSGESAAGRCPVGTLPSTAEPDEPGVPVGPDMYSEVLDTALFDAAPGGTVAFRHEQYSEYLAARYVTGRDSVTRAQIRDLLRAGPDGQVPGVFGGVLAWLLALRLELADDLVTANAPLLAQTGVELPSDEVRGLITSALLETARAGDTEPEWGYELSPLVHPALQSTLCRHLAAGLTDAGHLWWVARLTEAARCPGVAESLLAEALTEKWPAWARRQAVAAVAAGGDLATVNALSPLLRLDAERDPDDDLLASAIEALYPRLLSTTALLEVLRPRTNRSLVGAYLVLLTRLPELFAVGDLPEILEWASELTAIAGDGYGLFPERLVDIAWRNRRVYGVLPALARLVARLIAPSSGVRWTHRRKLPWEAAADEERRSLLVLIARNISPENVYDLITFHLAGDDDVDYLLATLPMLPAESWPVLVETLGCVFREPNRVQADAVLMMSEDHPAFAATAGFRGAVNPDSSFSEQRRRTRRRELLKEKEADDQVRRQRDRLTEAIAAADADATEWWTIARALAREGHDRDDLFTQDLTSRSGWKLLDELERETVFKIGFRYLERHQPTTGPEHLDHINDLDVIPDWSGVYFLTTLAAHRPEAVRGLDVEVWRRWASPIVTAWNNDHDDNGRKLRQALLGLAQPPARVALADAALAALPAESDFLPQHATYRSLTPELASRLATRLLRGDHYGPLGVNLVGLLVKEAPATASEFCLRLWETGQAMLADAALRGLAEHDPDLVFKLYDEHKLDAEELANVAPCFEVAALSDPGVGLLARILVDRHPPHQDPPWSERPNGNWEVVRARDRVLGEVVARGFVNVLEDLHKDQHETDRWVLARYLRQARARARDMAFSPVAPAELLQLLGRADARLVGNDEDLQSAVIEALRDLQHTLRRDSHRDVWNLGDVATPQSEDDISDWVRRNLEQRLGGGSVVGRELQVRRLNDKGIGTRADLTIVVSTATQPRRQIMVIVEAKLVNHRELFTAMRAQLAERYLEPMGLRCGIYLVYWVDPAQRPQSWRGVRSDLTVLFGELAEQARGLEPKFRVVPFVLDISRPVS